MTRKPKLTDKDRSEAMDTLSKYARAYYCRKCRVIYGSDFENEDGFCPRCLREKEANSKK